MIAVLAAFVVLQCPDGSPPPCGRAARPAAPSLALNDNTWLVLPFENTARAADADLIRHASVPQLSGEMARWEGVRVISDDRVADLLQQLPDAQRERPGLEAARGLARRVGAGKIVLGGFLAAGGRANLTVKVYETRTGRELRTVRDPLSGFQGAAALDSLGASFGRLARGILDVPAGTEGSASVGVGTSSLEAYRAYVAGMDAFNRLQVDSAARAFTAALRADPGFAMARLQLWRVSQDTVAGRAHFDSVMRMASSLPPRARLLVEAMGAAQRGDLPQVCTNANQLVAGDSADADGWALLSGCYNDRTIELVDGQPRLRGDLNKALRAAERALALSPQSINARSALAGILNAAVSFMQCVGQRGGLCPWDRNYRVSILTAGDSLQVRINLWRDVKHAPPDLTFDAIEGQNRRLRRLAAMMDQIAATSDLWVMHNQVAQVSFAAGDIATAEAHFGRGVRLAVESEGAKTIYYNGRFEVALARERVPEFRAYAESLFARPTLIPSTLAYKALMGDLGEGGMDTSAGGRENARWRQILAGILPAGFDSLEQRMTARLTGPQRDDFLQLTTLAAFHLRRTGPALDTAARHPLKRFQAWFARGDQARARAALGEFDRELANRHIATPDDGGWLFSAESHLELGDTATAFQRMQEFGRRWSTSIFGAYILEMRYFQSTTPRLWGRAWLLFGDLAMTRGQRAEARRAYRMVVGLWERGDAVLQPAVTRARNALAQLGG